jgi:hypothetical protein
MTVMEKAQDRKKKTNLEDPKGIAYNPFSVLIVEDVTTIALDSGIVLGSDSSSKVESLLDILEKDDNRRASFVKSCPSCQVEDKLGVVSNCFQGEEEEDAPCTPKNQIIQSQRSDLSDEKG